MAGALPDNRGSASSIRYYPRDPGESPLYQTIGSNLETFLARQHERLVGGRPIREGVRCGRHDAECDDSPQACRQISRVKRNASERRRDSSARLCIRVGDAKRLTGGRVIALGVHTPSAPDVDLPPAGRRRLHAFCSKSASALFRKPLRGCICHTLARSR